MTLRETINPLQKIPTDEEIDRIWGVHGYNHLSDFKKFYFKGIQLIDDTPNFLGDRQHVFFLDESVRKKIRKDGEYKCICSIETPNDPGNRNTYVFVAYIEEEVDNS